MIYMDVYMNSYFPHNLDTENSIIDLSKWQELADLIVDIFGADCGAIIKFTGHSFTTMLSSRNEANFLHKGTEWSSDSKSFCRTIIKTGKPLYIANAVEDEYWFDAPPVVNGPVRSYCGVPIFSPDGSLRQPSLNNIFRKQIIGFDHFILISYIFCSKHFLLMN